MPCENPCRCSTACRGDFRSNMTISSPSSYEKLSNGYPEAETAIAMRRKAFVMIKALLPLADDDVLIDLNKVVGEKYRVLSQYNPSLCYAFGTGADSAEISSAFPDDLLRRERDLYERAIATATPRPAPDPRKIGGLQAALRRALLARGRHARASSVFSMRRKCAAGPARAILRRDHSAVSRNRQSSAGRRRTRDAAPDVGQMNADGAERRDYSIGRPASTAEFAHQFRRDLPGDGELFRALELLDGVLRFAIERAGRLDLAIAIFRQHALNRADAARGRRDDLADRIRRTRGVSSPASECCGPDAAAHRARFGQRFGFHRLGFDALELRRLLDFHRARARQQHGLLVSTGAAERTAATGAAGSLGTARRTARLVDEDRRRMRTALQEQRIGHDRARGQNGAQACDAVLAVEAAHVLLVASDGGREGRFDTVSVLTHFSSPQWQAPELRHRKQDA